MCINIYADIPLIIEIQNVTVNGGNLIIEIFSNENSYNDKRPNSKRTIESNSRITLFEIQMPEGEYVVVIHQDTNGNGVIIYWEYQKNHTHFQI